VCFNAAKIALGAVWEGSGALMARQVHNRDISSTLAAAEKWINGCLIGDGSIFSEASLWTALLVDEVHHAFVEHPDFGKDDFMTKLKGQIKAASPSAQQLMAEMLWALLLFPSNMKARTKRKQIADIWSLSGQRLSGDIPPMREEVLVGIGSGGPGFNNYRPEEMTFLIALTRDLKRRETEDRRTHSLRLRFISCLDQPSTPAGKSAISTHASVLRLPGSCREDFFKQRPQKHP
jgi:hypothetical protein